MKQVVVLTFLPSVLISEGLSRILHSIKNPQITVIKVESPETMIEKAETLRPAVIFTDPLSVRLKEIEHLKEEYPEIRIAGISASILPEPLTKAFDDNIYIYDGVDSIENIIRTVSQKKEEGQKELSPREKEIVVGIVKGLSNKEIAAEANISVHTVMTHRKNIAAKLQIHSTAALTIYAIVSKLVNLEEIKV